MACSASINPKTKNDKDSISVDYLSVTHLSDHPDVYFVNVTDGFLCDYKSSGDLSMVESHSDPWNDHLNPYFLTYHGQNKPFSYFLKQS